MKSFMKIALIEANQSLIVDEVPVGAVIVNQKGLIIAKSGNRNRELNDPTAHAEILAIRMACVKNNSDKLFGCNIFVTLQPCEMCLHAIIKSRIARLYFGASDTRNDMLQNTYYSISKNKNLKLEIYPNIFEKECSTIIKKFFKDKRNKVDS